MNNLNSCLIEGNLVRDPQLKQTPNGHDVCSFTIASNRYYKSQEGMEKETLYIDIEAWGELARSCERLGSKGRGAKVVGRLKQNRWHDAEGKSQSRFLIVAEHVQFRPVFNQQEEQEKEELDENL